MTNERLFFALGASEAEGCTGDSEALLVLKNGCRSFGKPVPDNNLHLTLAFLGNVSGIQKSALVTEVGKMRFKQFSVSAEKVALWTRSGILRLDTSLPDTLGSLSASLHSLAVKCGIAVETRQYHPHFTLCRKAHDGNWPQPEMPLRFTFSEFGLYRSQPSKDGKGVIYTRLHHWPLY
ncbi:RNA 2',3'-cyclic phosphodiesterase [Parasalinivibrio latis]|uniref:RNA 2',3'-cyclic phosphodiesterase n=1 Tax=Parasalinivibrio latis TaxID=2952610 RepID=UPI0030E1109C